MTKINEIMEPNAYYCREQDTVGEVLTILAEKKVSGVPVVNEKMQVVGFISDGDIMDFISRKRTYMMDFHGAVMVGYGNDNFDSKLHELLRLNVMSNDTLRFAMEEDGLSVAYTFARKAE